MSKAKGTIFVHLAKNWLAPSGAFYEVSGNPHEFPADWGEEETVEVEGKKEKRYKVLPSSAEIVDGGRTVAVEVETANGEKLLKGEVVEDGVTKVGGALDKAGIEQPSQTVPAAEAGAKAVNVQVGGKPRESGPETQVGANTKK